MKISHRSFRRVFQFLALVLLLAATTELFFRFALSSPAERRAGAAALFRAHASAAFPPILSNEGCADVDQLAGSPYLNTLYRSDGPCRAAAVNNMGFRSDRFHPLTRSPDTYAILLSGGAGAEQIASSGELEAALNREYRSPTGRPFRVYNAAMPTWVIADQLKAVTMLAPTVDAVLILGGNNEARYWRERQFDSPIPIHYLHTHHSSGGAIFRETIHFFRRFAIRSVLLRHSHIMYRLFLWAAENYERNRLPEDLRSSILGAYEFPPTWSAEERARWNSAKLAGYLDTFRAISDAAGIPGAYAVEPLSSESIQREIRAAGKRGLPILEGLSATQLAKLWRLERK